MARDWNYLKKMFMQKCSVTDISIVIETALEAAIPTMYQISEYTCGDIMKMRGGHTWGAAAGAFKAIGGKKRRSGVRRMGGCGRRMSASPGGAGAIFGERINQFKFLYEVTGLAFVEGALFKFFLFEVGKDFLINWMTLAYAAEKCSLPPAGVIYTGWDALVTGSGHPVQCFIGPGHTVCASSGGHEIHVEPGCNASISWSGRWEPFLGHPNNLAPVKMWLQDDRGVRWDETPTEVQPGKNYITQAGGVYDLPGRSPGGTTYQLFAEVGPGGLMTPNVSMRSSLVINTTGRPVNFTPMGGCGATLAHGNKEIWTWLNSPDALDKFGNKVLSPWFKDLNAVAHGDRPAPDVEI